MDLSHEQNAIDAVKGATEVYNLAADMGGMGFIEHFRVECLRSILVNTHLTEASYRAGVQRYFFSSSACAYNTDLQKSPDVIALEGIRCLPGHGRARLRLGEAHQRDVLPGVLGGTRPRDPHRPLPQHLRPQRHLVRRSREGPAAMCRKVLEAQDSGDLRIQIWGDGTQTRIVLLHRRLPARHRPDHAYARS